MCRRYFLSLFLSSCEEEQEDILFQLISFEVIKIKNVLKLRILLYFSSNKRSIPLVSPPGYRPTRIYAHQKRLFSGYKPWAYIHYFTVLYLPFLTLSHSAPAPPLCVNPDRKMLLTWNSTQSYFVMLQKNWRKKKFQICSYSNDGVTNYVNFLKNYAKSWLKYVFFVKLTLWQLEKRFSRSFFSFWNSR